jgi:hypothetical protein
MRLKRATENVEKRHRLIAMAAVKELAIALVVHVAKSD